MLGRSPWTRYRRDDEFKVLLDLPGTDPGSIELTVDNDVLTVRGTRTWLRFDDDQIAIAERPKGQFSRQLFLGESLDRNKITASYEDGVLAVTIPVIATGQAPQGQDRSRKGRRRRPSPQCWPPFEEAALVPTRAAPFSGHSDNDVPGSLVSTARFVFFQMFVACTTALRLSRCRVESARSRPDQAPYPVTATRSASNSIMARFLVVVVVVLGFGFLADGVVVAVVGAVVELEEDEAVHIDGTVILLSSSVTAPVRAKADRRPSFSPDACQRQNGSRKGCARTECRGTCNPSLSVLDAALSLIS